MGNNFEQFSDSSSEAIEEEEIEEPFLSNERANERAEGLDEDLAVFDRAKFAIEAQEIERESLERSPSKLKRAFLAATAAAALMMGAAGFGGVAGEAYAASLEDTHIESTEKEDRSPEEIRLFVELEKSGYTEEESTAFTDFARERNIPINDFFTVMENMSGNSDKLLLLKSYAIAYDAVSHDKLSGDVKERFMEHVLPALKNGYVDVIKMTAEEMKGSEAVYDGKNDAYKDTGIDLKSSGDMATTIHELMHVAQDSMELTQERKEAEHEAYKAGTEYTMRETHIIQKNEEGEMAFGKKILMEEVRTEYEKLIIFEYALRNAEAGRNNLNTIVAGEIECSMLDNAEAVAFYKMQIEALNEFTQALWASSTDMGSMISGKMINVGESFVKDGLAKKKEAK